MLVRFAKTALWRLNREVGGIKFFFCIFANSCEFLRALNAQFTRFALFLAINQTSKATITHECECLSFLAKVWFYL